MIVGIAQIALLVKDYDEAIDFYCGKLGFFVIEDSKLEQKRWIRLSPPGRQGSELLLSKVVDEKQKVSVGNQAGGRVLFFLHTNDFTADYDKFKSLGVEFIEGPFDMNYGRVAVFKDLYGNRIDLIQPISNQF